MTKWITAIIAAVAISGASLMAVSIKNLSGQSCGDADGNWHFVHNQTGGAAGGTLTATFTGGQTCIVGASKVNASTIHYNCNGFSGTLLSASDNVSVGNLVLSDFSCDTKEPPPCVPTPKDPCK